MYEEAETTSTVGREHDTSGSELAARYCMYTVLVATCSYCITFPTRWLTDSVSRLASHHISDHLTSHHSYPIKYSTGSTVRYVPQTRPRISPQEEESVAIAVYVRVRVPSTREKFLRWPGKRSSFLQLQQGMLIHKTEAAAAVIATAFMASRMH